MEAENRAETDRLALLQALADQPHAFSFFQAVRLLERAHADKPRLGTSRRLADDPYRLGQDLALDFAPATLSTFLPGGPAQPPRLQVRFFGLTGPNGPLPIHITEYIHDRTQRAQVMADRTLVHFLDVFHHRLLSLFYRAWAEAQPTVSLDRPDQDKFGGWVGALAGYGTPALHGRDAVPDIVKRAAVGLLSRQVRNAEGLALVLAAYFQVPTEVRPWHPQWMPLPEDACSRLGDSTSAGLGRSAVLGRRVWDAQSSFLVVMGPLSLAQFRRFLPGQPGLGQLRDWVLNYVGAGLSCRLQLVLRREAVPPVRLGQSGALGHTSWLGRRQRDADADDLTLNLV